MISSRRFRAIVKKEFIELLRDKRTLAVMILMPILQLILFTNAIEGDLDNLPLAWVDHENSILSRQLRSRIATTEHFNLKDYSSRSEAENDFLTGKVNVIVVIPADFTRSLTRLEKTQIQLLIDGTDPNLARTSTGYLQAIMGNFFFEEFSKSAPPGMQIVRPFDLRIRMLYNEDLSTERYMIPGLLAYIIAFLTLMITALAMVKELESGTFEQLFVTPVTRLEVIIGKLLPYGIAAIVIACLISIAGFIFFGIGVRGSIIALLVVAMIFSVSMLASGLFISVNAKSSMQAIQVAASVTVPALLISGFMFPVFTMPVFYQILSKALPLTWALIAFRGIYLKGWGMLECLPYILILILFVILNLIFTTRAFNRRIG